MEIDNNKLITISRNCDATMIPAGEKIILIEGTHVRITQSLGGNLTVLVNGNLVKVSGKDADALGLDEENQSELHDARLEKWFEMLVPIFNLSVETIENAEVEKITS